MALRLKKGLAAATEDEHRRATWLGDVILGGQDGLVNVLGVVLGVAAATAHGRIVLAAGLAAAFAESVSMGAVAYTSKVTAGEVYRSERAREYRHIGATPEVERAEIRDIYERKGFSGELLDRIVERITADPDVWVAVMMAEEHQLMPVAHRESLRSSLIVAAASLVGSLLPLIPFALLPVAAGIRSSIALGASVLFLFGAYKTRMTVGNPLWGGIQLALIGTLSALLGYLVGALLRVPV
jgi:VIT1/CCC1 family predicted Fe2+/Mn2+ transporter